MSFTGNPGTGKTTVALRMAEILHRLGYVETPAWSRSRATTSSASTSATPRPRPRRCSSAPPAACCSSTRPTTCTGPENERDYGQEAIEILLQVMEAERDRLVVVLAGYKDRMDAFFGVQPRHGLARRPPHRVPGLQRRRAAGDRAADARPSASYELGDDAGDALRAYVERRREQPRFANARSLRNAIDRARLRHAGRLFAAAARRRARTS